jgi:predicted component of type VI protein secretion system
MRSSLPASIAIPRAGLQQSFRKSLQKDAAIREYCTALPAPVIQAQYGAKHGDRSLTMLAANVGRLSNNAARTTINLLFGALDVGVPVEVVLQVPEKLASLIRARVQTKQARRCMKELHRAETEIEGRLNNLQMAMVTGQATVSDLIEGRKRIAELQKTLAEMDAELERTINDATVNRDTTGSQS